MKALKIKNYSHALVGTYPFHDNLKKELVPLLEESVDTLSETTNVKATHTVWNWLPDNTKVKNLKKFILSEIKEYYKPGCINEDVRNLDVVNFWGNLYEKNDYTRSHHHIPFLYSFAYILKSKWYHPSFIFTDSGKKIPSKEGTYNIFPSYMWHHVPKNRFKEYRMTLSGNVSEVSES